MFIKLFAIALPVYVILDLVWVGLIANGFYRNQLGSLMRTQPNWWAIVVFYLIFLVALVTLVISPAVAQDSYVQALLFGALFGLATYGTYNLINLGLTTGWPLTMSVVDMGWGVVVSAAVSLITFYFNRMLS